MNPWNLARALLTALIVVALIATLTSCTSIRDALHITTSCYVGVNGTNAVVYFQGVGADTVCGDLVQHGIPINGGGLHGTVQIYSASGPEPGSATVCQGIVSRNGDTLAYSVYDKGLLMIVGAAACKTLGATSANATPI